MSDLSERKPVKVWKKVSITQDLPKSSKKDKKQKKQKKQVNIRKVEKKPRPMPEDLKALLAPNVSNNVNQISTLTFTALSSIAWGYITQALARGWLANAPSSDYPAAAYQFIVSIFTAYANGSTPAAQTLPYWMICLGHAISPKTVPFQRGGIFYKFDSVVDYTPPPSQPLGPIAYGYEGVLYTAGTSTIDLFPVATVPTITSDPKAAFNALIAFVSQVKTKTNLMMPIATETPYGKDVSVFCNTALEVGGGVSGQVGGTAFVAQLEVPIRTPLLAPISLTVGQTAQQGNVNRVPSWTIEFSGDQISNPWLMHTFLDPSKWKTKIRPKYKFIDFLEFLDVLAIWASKLVTEYWKDPANNISTSVGGVQNPSLVQCPLTLQELGLLLRNDLLFCLDSQCGVQGLYPVLPQGASDNEFVAFVQGTTTVPLASSKMKVPKPFAENINSLVAVHAGSHQAKDINLYVPVVGKYFLDELNPEDYTFTYNNGTPQQYPVFSAEPTVQKRTINKAGVVEYVNVSEAAIDYVDGYSSGSYVFINDQRRLQQLSALWNRWVSTFQSYSSPITVLDRGMAPIPLLCTHQTSVWSTIPPSVRMREADVQDLRLVACKVLSSTPYANRQVVAQTYHSHILGEVDEIVTKWIVPTARLAPGSNTANSQSFVKIQQLNQEPFSRTFSSEGDAGVTSSSRHVTYAESMIHGRDGKSSMDDLFSALDAAGHGGILSSLVAGMVGKTFGGTAGAIANTIADALPI